MNASRFLDIFDCQRENYYTFVEEGKRERDSKTEGKYDRYEETVTVDVIEKHLNGIISVGLIPTRRDGTCSWGVIDVDGAIYHKDPVPVLKKIREKGYPLVPYRSKTSGLHLYLHIKGSVSAAEMRKKIHALAADLGFGGTLADKFPNEDAITKDKNGKYKVGKCVNMPYQGTTKGYCTRYCLTDDGKAISIDDFFDHVEKFRITPKQFDDLTIQTENKEQNGPEPEWNEYPPCTQAFISNKVGEGQRNNALFNLAVLAHLKNPDQLKTELYERNKTCMNPPVERDSELDAIVAQIKDKEYFYQCETPIAKQFCNKEACRKRKYGIGPNQYIPTVDSFFKHNTNPPYYVLTMEGNQIQLLGKQIVQQQLLREELFDQADIVWQTLNKRDWNMFLVSLKAMQKEVEDMKPGDDEKEDFNYYTRMFIQETEPGDDISQLQAGYIFKDDEFVYFNLHTFKDFLNKKKGKKSNQEVIRYLKNGGSISTTKLNQRVWQIALPEKINIKPKKVDFKSRRDDEKTPF
jgi:hypothetical protein